MARGRLVIGAARRKGCSLCATPCPQVALAAIPMRLVTQVTPVTCSPETLSATECLGRPPCSTINP